jgi:hypothetical protein
MTIESELNQGTIVTVRLPDERVLDWGALRLDEVR